MAFQTLNGYDVEHASSLLVYENLFPEIQHINGKGCIDKYTPSDRVESITYIDIMRVLPYAPRYRKVGATNNGAYHNAKNNGYSNAPQSTYYTIPIDLIYDEGVPITDVQIYSNPVALKSVILAQLIKVAGLSINIITYAKQIEGFFRVGDNFHKAKTHAKGSIVAGDVTDDELNAAVFQYDPTVAANVSGSAPNAFILANASLSDGIPEIGALTVPTDERQAFVTPSFNALMKNQYMQNASEASARILASGFMNPFTEGEGARINSSTGLCGMYDGVDCFLFNKVTRAYVYTALGLDDTTDADVATCRDALDNLAAMIVYGAGTCRGIVGPQIIANPNPYYGGVYILPKMKVGVECLHGGSIKLIVNGGASLATKWGTSTVILLMNTLTFTPIDGLVVTGNVAGFNDGTTN